MACFFAMNLANAQYISRCQPVENDCPIVCPGSVMTLEVFQVQSLNQGDTVQALLSNATGSFSSGTTTLSFTQYNLTSDTSWTPGPFIYSSDVNNLYFQITIPVGLPAGTGYTIKMKTSAGYIASDLFQCSGGNYFTVTSAYATLSPQPASTEGTNQWIGHVYTWSATTTEPLFTSALIDEQDFFDPLNYKGYFLEDSLSFDINYLTATGGVCPGQPEVLNNGTSIPCSQGYADNFSIRLLRKQNFAPGTYRLAIDGDDGIRLSIDGGNTWILSSFLEQTYANGYHSTDSAYPNGICLSGATDLVIEYFQRLVDSHLTFTATLLSGISVADAGNQSTCAGGDATFTLSGSGNLSYQWYYSANGNNFIPVVNSNTFSGANTSALSLNNVSDTLNNYIFRCNISGVCGNAVNTASDTLFVGGTGTQTTINANKTTICSADSATLCAPGNCTAWKWSTGQTTACITTYAPGTFNVTVTYNGGCTSVSNPLTISVISAASISLSQSGDTLTVYTGLQCQWYNGANPVNGATDSIFIATVSGVYSVVLTDGSGCTSQSSPIKIGATGVDEITAANQFNVYPNPAVNSCVVLPIFPESDMHPLQIFDDLGCLLMQVNLHAGTTDVNLSSLADGVYFFRLGSLVKKVVKQ